MKKKKNLPKMDMKLRFLASILILAVKNNLLNRAEDNFNNFDFKSEFHTDLDKEIMLAQESKQKLTVVEPPISIVKPKGIVNSHRPQYDIDSLEADYLDKYKYSNKLDHLFDAASKKTANRFRSRQAMIRDAVLKALERKDHVGKFAQIIPIVRSMTDSQRIALASLVAGQVITPPGRSPLNLSQVRSMFDDGANSTSELMLPILFDMANLIRRAARPGKQPREARRPLDLPSAHALRRSSDAEEIIDLAEYKHHDWTTVPAITTTTTKKPTRSFFQRSLFANRSRTGAIIQKKENISETLATDFSKNDTSIGHTSENNGIKTSSNNATKLSAKLRSLNLSNQPEKSDDSAHQVDATNQTSTQDLPVAEKLRALTRFADRQGNIVRRGQRPPNKPSITVTRRTTAEPAPVPSRKRTVPARKLHGDPKCELFTNSLCLHVDDYPLEAILLSIRRNKATTSALLADYRDPNEGAIDGVTAAQEAKYTPDHYLASNRRGDAANRDFAGAGEGGFMCPSSVKYARPQRARATSGQWKYIVNTGEHTQTLRLEKCLKPKESCTYLNENFKSKCVQVYNYHRLLTWDQQNGLHMDIFKVPTCCSCHIEGYSVSFPPLVQNIHETPLEHFPGEAISPDHGNGDFESIQPTAPRPSVIKNSQYGSLKPTESFSTFRENQNFIAEAEFPPKKIIENDDFSNGNIATGPVDSYGNNYFLDSFNEASSIKNIKRPTSARKPVRSNNFESSITLPSFLQPPTPTADSAFASIRDSQTKYKSNGNLKRGFSRLNRKPTRKNISGEAEDLLSSGTSVVDTQTSAVIENLENFRNQKEEYYSHTGALNKATIAPKLKIASLISSESMFLPTLPTVSENRSVPRDAIQGKRVNYNYHPIIDFFDDNEKHDNGKSSIDRGDSVSTLIPMQEMDWKPINTPILT